MQSGLQAFIWQERLCAMLYKIRSSVFLFIARVTKCESFLVALLQAPSKMELDWYLPVGLGFACIALSFFMIRKGL